MDRPTACLRLFAGSLALLAASGCSSFHHRGRSVPPAPRAVRDGSGAAGFGSDPSPTISAANGVMPPAGPVSNSGAYGPAGAYNGAPASNEPTSAPLGEPAPAAGAAPAGAESGVPKGY